MEMLLKIKKHSQSGVGHGIKWNMVSVVFLAVSGMVYTLVIAGVYTPDVVAYFSLAFALYTAMSQATVFGIHYSVLKYISEFAKNEKKCNVIIGSALALVTITSVVLSVIFFVLTMILSNIMDDLALVSLLRAIPALVFFSINKVLLNYYNGKSLMKEYAIFQSIRNVLLMGAIVAIALLKLSGIYLTYSFLISEGILFVIIAANTIIKKYIKLNIDFEWIKEHYRFGLKIMPSSLVVDLNFRTDLICLWIIGVNSEIRGVYSFAIVFAQGFYQLLVVIRRNINPQIAQYYSEKKFDKLEELRKTVKKYVPKVISVLSVVLIIGYVCICYIIGNQDYLKATIPLAIILLSMSINSYYTCFGNALNQMGLPKQESVLNVLTLGSNFVLNLAIIPFLGIYGAATATAISYFVFSTVLYNLVKRKGKYNLSIAK